MKGTTTHDRTPFSVMRQRKPVISLQYSKRNFLGGCGRLARKARLSVSRGIVENPLYQDNISARTDYRGPRGTGKERKRPKYQCQGPGWSLCYTIPACAGMSGESCV